MIGVDHRSVARQITRLVPDYMVMGERGMHDMTEMQMPLPDNTAAVMTGIGPFGAVGMGGMFSVLADAARRQGLRRRSPLRALHLLSDAFLGGGFWLLSSARNVLYHAQRRQALAVSGPYARIHDPQYAAFVLILFGFLLQWPAPAEEAELRSRFGPEFEPYAERTPRFVPGVVHAPNTA